MNIQLRCMKGIEGVEVPLEDANIESFIEEELDGPEFINILLNVSGSMPVVAGSVAATLVAVNKSIEEFKKLTKNIFSKRQDSAEVGIYEQGMKKLGPNASDEEIEMFFEQLKIKAKSEIENSASHNADKQSYSK